MVTANRVGPSYGVEISNGQSLARSDTRKLGAGGDTGMRPHELLESALAACICMSIDMAAQRAAMALPALTVTVALERLDHESGFDVSLRFAAPLSDAQRALAREAVAASPVARTLGKTVRVRPATVDDA
ncbi:OsmC family protein [Achromobacter xylosoxidans]|uniref:OsmC family protein n=1 Tax=Alcaligenes xylosoxydans xylosoxydans TaxID=85698 RepID=UPI0006C44E7E|nr:OsmC family protein [Achromobacter xylosoxidans]CUJ41368.1 OsmC-like protein [Achromobacter xylosoxidans]CUJ64023.1 OsmC-like protein [Achromobacter xylosoxidans]CUK20652.1 OsmC-like protein [Achromobacter xylosoxidans]